HKVGAYARLYSALHGTAITDMTLTFVVGTHPKKMLDYLKEVYRYEVQKKRPGIYHVRGDILPIQIVENRELHEEDSIWLKDLTGGLDGVRLQRVLEKSEGLPKGSPLAAYISMVLRANPGGFREVMAMPDMSFESVLEEFGLTTKWENKGREEGREETVNRLYQYGMAPEQIAEALMLPPDTVAGYLKDA
ncbi:MAG: hypothetical protein LBG10_00860, partial [Treponema sp.]|nr:hypothetical protein [Treponema sp.]